MSVFRRFGAPGLLLLCCAIAACSGPVRIGAVISEDGDVAPYGQMVTRGLDLARDELNANGGFHGSPIELIYRNDASDPETGARAVEDLIDRESAHIIIGAVASSVTLKIAPICESRQVLLLSPSSSAPPITDAGEYVFRNYPSDILEGTAMADFAREQGLKRVVIFAQANEFGQGLTDVFSRRFESRTREVVMTFEVGENTEALDGRVRELESIEPDGVYLITYVAETVRILDLLRRGGIRPVIMAASSFTEEIRRQAGAAAEDVVYPQPAFDLASSAPAVVSFRQAYLAKYGSDPDVYAAHGYDALKLILLAMKNSDSVAPDDVRRGLLAIEGYEGAAGRTQFDDKGDVVRYPRLFIVHGGESVAYDKYMQEGGKNPVPES